MFRTFFIGCSFTDEGLAPLEEFEEQINKGHTCLTLNTIDCLLNLITSKKDKSKVSYFKLKNVIKALENDIVHHNMHSSKQMRNIMCTETPASPSQNGLSEIQQLKESKSRAKGRNHRLESYLNQVELRMEEKFKNIGHAFRTFDTDGDSRITFQEFWLGLEKIGIFMNRATCQELFDYLDENNDKYIEFTEF